MLRTIFWYAAGWTYLVATSPALLAVKYFEKKGEAGKVDAIAGFFSMMLARGLFYLTGSSLSAEGIEKIPDGPVLFVSNHQSNMDSAVIHGFLRRPKGFIADKDAENIPILGTWMKYMKCIFIDRKNARTNVKRMEEALRILKEGHSLVIYPEGRINTAEHLAEFKKGCLKLALMAGVPIVPVTLVNTGRMMNREGFAIHSAAVKCIISDPVYISESDYRSEAALVKKVKDIIANNLL